MAYASTTRPRIPPNEALRIATGPFGIPVTRAELLPSDRDQNFLLTDDGSGRRFVLKVAHAEEERATLDFQNRILEHMARAGFPLSKVLHATDGREIIQVAGPGEIVHMVRLMTWMPGRLLHEVSPQTPTLFENLGAFLGGMDRVLEDFSHPAQDRELKWDLKGAGRVVRSHMGYIEDPSRRYLLEEMSERFLERLGPLVPELRLSVIHADANDHNVLVAPLRPGADPADRRVTGVVDFGDALRSFTAGEAAIAGAYAMLGKADPLTVASHLVAGYHRSFHLREAEIAALFPLMGLRLCASVAISAHQKSLEPDNAYLTASEAPAWYLLSRLERESLDLPHYLFRQACGLEPVPRSRAVVQWLEENGKNAAPVVGDPAASANGEVRYWVGDGISAPFGELVVGSGEPPKLSDTPLHIFDLGVETVEFGLAPDPGDARAWTDLLFGKMRAMGAEVGIGRYDEVRQWYTSDIFQSPGDGAPEWRTVHLGVDLFLNPGSPVYAPFDAVVHSLACNIGNLDYGPTVILEHADGDVRFWTLYGHLADDVLSSLTPGQAIPRGTIFASIGSYPNNGNWAPHLHFQIITDTLGMEGNFPGVGRPSQREIWKALSPDPNLVLRIPDRAADEGVPGSGWISEPFPGPAEPGRPSGAPLSTPKGRTQEETLLLRKLYLGPNLSIAYDKPLTIVRGRGQFLYDGEGQAYLDCVNNVPHVGHGHPRVVEAGRRQMALLNTNTRYLHEYLVEYAERLVAMLPGNLSKVYFACTGSEANELALRMARAHTRREDVVVVEGGYHGHTSSLIDISPYKFDGPGGEGARRWVHKTFLPDPYRGRFRAVPDQEFVEGLPVRSAPGTRKGIGGSAPGGEPAEPEYLPADEVGPRYGEQVRQVVSLMRAEGRAPAAFFCEPLIGCGGQIVPPPGYLTAAYQHIRDAGGICVADEVQVGFGRVGTHFWAFEAQGVVPDIITLGKPMGNGHPMAAVITTPEIAASFDTGMEYFNTFGGNPVSCAIGLAVLDVIREERLQENARVVGERLLAGLKGLMDRHPLIGDVRGLGLYLGVELVKDPKSRRPAPVQAARVKERLRESRILLSTDGPDHNVLKIKPPMVFTAADADRLVAAMDRILGEEEFRN